MYLLSIELVSVVGLQINSIIIIIINDIYCNKKLR